MSILGNSRRWFSAHVLPLLHANKLFASKCLIDIIALIYGMPYYSSALCNKNSDAYVRCPICPLRKSNQPYINLNISLKTK